MRPGKKEKVNKLERKKEVEQTLQVEKLAKYKENPKLQKTAKDS